MTPLMTIGSILIFFGSAGLLPETNEAEKRNTPILLAIAAVGAAVIFVGFTLNI